MIDENEQEKIDIEIDEELDDYLRAQENNRKKKRQLYKDLNLIYKEHHKG